MLPRELLVALADHFVRVMRRKAEDCCGTGIALQIDMHVQEALLMVVNSPVPIGQVLTSVITAVLAGAFNLRAAHNMAAAVRRSLATRPAQ